ncbi:dynein light chain, cytoplasmic [Paracoccidioides brasiliensis]|uniref:Dynein light chain n=1 Tax=Paracoccidioides brasiliensis TaxID=121759 RepID=A0A1D2JF90_PARBR|nr:dynein light chain, cytoplasmic [Paracoccidioides brasiliensis]
MASEKREKLEAQIKSADMSEDMQQEAIEVATEAMDKYHIEKDIAQYIKKEFDLRKGATWHCIVGRNFGSFVTHAPITYTRNLDVLAQVLLAPEVPSQDALDKVQVEGGPLHQLVTERLVVCCVN